MAEHECKRCGTCCREMQSGVTFGDIYRIWSEYRRSKSAYDVFREATDGWMEVPSLKMPGYYTFVPKARRPCAFLGEDGCSIYDTRLVLCGAFPEDWLTKPPEGYTDGQAESNFVASLKCMKGVEPSPVRMEKVRAIRELLDGETFLTTELIRMSGAARLPVMAHGEHDLWNKRKAMEPRLNQFVRIMLTKNENMRRLKQNLEQNGFLKKYRELYPLDV